MHYSINAVIMAHTHVFNDLYKEYYRRSFLFAKSFVHVDEVSEEIASDALISLWEKMKQEDIYSPKDFLFRVIKCKSLDYLKHQALHLKLFESIDDWEYQDLSIRMSSLEEINSEDILSSELTRLIKEAINKLPEKTKKVFIMSRFDGLSGKEIAIKTGISAKGVEYHITKALRILSDELKDYLVLLISLYLIRL